MDPHRRRLRWRHRFRESGARPRYRDRFLADYDSGDHLHPNDAGYKAMGEAVDLELSPVGFIRQPKRAYL